MVIGNSFMKVYNEKEQKWERIFFLKNAKHSKRNPRILTWAKPCVYKEAVIIKEIISINYKAHCLE